MGNLRIQISELEDDDDGCKKTTQNPRGARKKVSRKGQKSMKGVPDNSYGELKLKATISITKTALNGLDNLSRSRNISRSDLVEKIGRNLLEIVEINL